MFIGTWKGAYLNSIRYQRVPVVQMIEFCVDSVVKLKAGTVHHIRSKLKIQFILTQMLDIVLDCNLYNFTWNEGITKISFKKFFELT